MEMLWTSFVKQTSKSSVKRIYLMTVSPGKEEQVIVMQLWGKLIGTAGNLHFWKKYKCRTIVVVLIKKISQSLQVLVF